MMLLHKFLEQQEKKTKFAIHLRICNSHFFLELPKYIQDV